MVDCARMSDQATIGQSWSAPTNSECHTFGDSPESYFVRLHGFDKGGTSGFKRGLPTQYYEVGNRLIADNSSRTTNAVNAIRICSLDGKPDDVAFEVSHEYGMSSLRALSLTIKNPKPAVAATLIEKAEEPAPVDYFDLLSRDALQGEGPGVPETGKVVIQGESAHSFEERNHSECDLPSLDLTSEPMEVEALVKEVDESSLVQHSSSSIPRGPASKVGNDKARHKMMRELMALGAVDLGIITDGSERSEAIGDCRNPECRLGCVCQTIKGAKPLVTHCGKVECMLDGCTCKGESYKNGKDSSCNAAEETPLFAICQTRAHYGMATQEYNSVAKFVRTPDGSYRTIERDKRERRVPIRYQDDAESERSAKSESLKQKQEVVKRRQDVVKPQQSKPKELKNTVPSIDLKIDDLQRERQDLIEKNIIKSSTVLLPMGRISQPSKISVRSNYHSRRSAPEPTKESPKRDYESSFSGRGDSPDECSSTKKPREMLSPIETTENGNHVSQCQRTQEYSWKRSEIAKYPPRWWTRRIYTNESHFDTFHNVGIFNDIRSKILLKKYPTGTCLFIRWDIFVHRVSNRVFNVTGILTNNGSIDLFINKPGGISFIQLLTKYKTIPGHLRKLQSGQKPTDSQSEWAVLKKLDDDWKWVEILMAPLNNTNPTEPLAVKDANKNEEPKTSSKDDSEEILIISSDEENEAKESNDELEILEEESTKISEKNLFLLKIRIGLPVPIKAPETMEAIKLRRKMDVNELRRRRLSNFCIIPKVVKHSDEQAPIDVLNLKEPVPTIAEVISMPSDYNPPFLDPPALEHFRIMYGLEEAPPSNVTVTALSFRTKEYPLHSSETSTRVILGSNFSLVADNQIDIPIIEKELKKIYSIIVDKHSFSSTEKEDTKSPDNETPIKSSKTYSSMEIRRKVIMARMKNIADTLDKGAKLDSNLWKENLRAHVFKLKSRNKSILAAPENQKVPEEERKPDCALNRPSLPTKISLAEKTQVDDKCEKKLVAKEDLLSTT